MQLSSVNHNRHRWTLELWERGNQARATGDRRELANATTRLSKHVPGAETLITRLQTVLTLTKRAESAGKLVIWRACVDPQELLKPRVRVDRKGETKVRMLARLVGIVVRADT